MLPASISDSVEAIPLGEPAVQAEVQLQVLHRAAHGADRRHAAHGKEKESGPAQDRAKGRGRLAGARHGRGRGLTHEQRGGQRHHDHQQAQRAQRPPPADGGGERVREQRHQRAAHSDSQVGHAHRLPARGLEPARQQHLVGQRAAAHVAQGVQQVEEVERGQAGHGGEADQREAGHHDAEQHEAPRPEPVHRQPGQEPECGTDDQLAEGVARRHLPARPAELLHEEVVEEGQSVQGDAHDGKEGQEGGEQRQSLVAPAVRHGAGHAWREARERGSRAASGWAP